MPTGQRRHVIRTDTLELKSQLEMKIGRAKTMSYLNLLSKFLSLKISKSDFDKLIVDTVKKENISLHNALLRGLIKNASLSNTPPLIGNGVFQTSLGFNSLCNDLPQSSPCKERTQRRFSKDCNGKSQITEVVSSSFKKQWSMEDGEEVDQLIRCWRSQPIEAPFGVNLRDFIKRRRHVETCYSSRELPDSISLKKKLEDEMKEEGVEVSVGFANSLNAGLDVFLQRLIKPCLELAASRSSSRGEVCSSSVSMVDFHVAMESNPSILGEDWSSKLEKIRSAAPDLPSDFQTS